MINPLPAEVVSLGYQQACRLDVAFDDEYINSIPGNGYLGEESGNAKPETHEVHIAEKFRMAYVSRAQRIQEKMKRNYQQHARRQFKQSAAQQAITQWENAL